MIEKSKEHIPLKKRKKARGKKIFNGKINELEKCHKPNMHYRSNIFNPVDTI